MFRQSLDALPKCVDLSALAQLMYKYHESGRIMIEYGYSRLPRLSR